MKFFVIFLAVFVLGAMVLHIIHLDHKHPCEFFGDGMQALTHGERKKWFLPAVVLFLLLIFKSSVSSFISFITLLFLELFTVSRYKQQNFIIALFADGILNPKIYHIHAMPVV